MGQRSQIIIKYPAMKYNKNNPNNYESGFIVYHNQWNYGGTFLLRGLYILNGIKTLIKQNRESCLKNYPIDYIELIKNAILYADNKDLTIQKQSFEVFNSIENKKDFNSFEEFLSWFDNNNGYFIIIINKDNSLSFDILSGLEDTEEIKHITPLKYLNLFYDNNKIIKITGWEYIKAIEELSKYKQFNSFKVFKDFKIRGV